MNDRTRASWLVYVLGALCAGAIVAAVLVVGPASGSQSTVTRTATAAQGVVQSTVSGSGNLQSVSQLNLGFKTSGTVTHIYMSQGEQVAEGQLLATLDPQSAEVSLEQAKAALQSAEANLAKEEETDGETSSGSGAGSAPASTASVTDEASAETATAAHPTAATGPDGPPAATTTPAGAPATTTPHTDTAPASTTPSSAAPTGTSPSRPKTTTTASPDKTTTATHEREASQTSSGSSSKATVSPATREANIASARAQVKSDRLTVQGAEQAVQDTKLYAPGDGTIVSLSGQVGEVVSGGGTTKASSASSSSSGSGSSATGTAGAATAGRSGTGTSAAAGSSSSSASTASSGSQFAVLSDLASMELVVPLSESEIGHVRVGQIATVTVEALEGRKLAAHVSEVATLSTSNSGVVSYDVTFQLDQMEAGLKPGMSATAEVVVKQEEGVNVPTSAISGGMVTVIENGKQVRRRVVAGLAGNSSTIILSGLKAGEKVALPVATSTTSTLGTRSGSGRGGLGGAALGGGGGGFGAGGGLGGGAALFRGGG